MLGEDCQKKETIVYPLVSKYTSCIHHNHTVGYQLFVKAESFASYKVELYYPDLSYLPINIGQSTRNPD